MLGDCWTASLYEKTIDSISMYVGASGNAQVGANLTNVTAQYLKGSDNMAGQADDGDCMMPANAFLVVQYGEETFAPSVESITITPDDEPAEDGVQINPNAGNNKTVNISAVVSDPNGWEDINTVEAAITGPGTVADSPVTLNLVSHDTTTATFNGTFNMSFYYLDGTYTVNVTAADSSSLTGSDSTTFEYKTAIALELDAGTIAFGSVDPDETSEVLGDEDMTTLNNATVRNIGNVIIDVEVNGTNMTSNGNVITKDNIGARINEKSYQDMSVARCFDVNIEIGEQSLENADFKLYVPYGTPQGGYSGTITLTAATC